MSTWKELPRPATPGPWVVRNDRGEPLDQFYGDVLRPLDGDSQEVVCEWAGPDAPAIAALPDYVAEVDRLRAWVDWLLVDWPGEIRDRIRAGEWPEGREP